MVFDLSRSQIAPRKDPHDWNTWDHYQSIHESRLRQHPFVVDDTITFTHEGEDTIRQQGMVQCHKNVMLEVDKWFEARVLWQHASGPMPYLHLHRLAARRNISC